jgi:DNA mismatch endonuclease (patch repair protein)
MNHSETMRRIKSGNTRPLDGNKIIVTQNWFSWGYRINYGKLPGKPDISYIGKRKLIFLNGCFWHGHDFENGLRRSKTNTEFWSSKIERNRQRYIDVVALLKKIFGRY